MTDRFYPKGYVPDGGPMESTYNEANQMVGNNFTAKSVDVLILRGTRRSRRRIEVWTLVVTGGTY